MLSHELFITIRNGKCCLFIPNGYNDKIKPSDAKELIPLIEQYIAENSDDSIAQENFENAVRLKKQYEQFINEKENNTHSGYVYLFECGGKYKIGYSNNVERRLNQLDTRPFKLNFIAKVYSDIAFDVEQEMHRRLQQYKVSNEWYEFKFQVPPERFEKLVKITEKDIKEAKQ